MWAEDDLDWIAEGWSVAIAVTGGMLVVAFLELFFVQAAFLKYSQIKRK